MSGKHKPQFKTRRQREAREARAAEAQAPSNAATKVMPEDEHSSFLGRLTTGSKGTIGELTEDFERSQVGSNDPGKLIPISEGRAGKGSRISVHGMNGAPEAVDPLTQMAVDSGARTSTFAYDDMTRRLGDSSDDLLAALVAEMQANPDGPLTIDAHSMGTRVTLDAVRKLVESGQLGDRELELNLVAPLLAGVTENGGKEAMTNLSRLALPGMGTIPGVRPGKDMGSYSPFQEGLDGMQLPENVRTHLITGADDPQVDTDDPRWQAIKERLNATHTSIEGRDHTTVVPAAAELLGRR